MNRNNFNQLPDQAELRNILDAEVARNIPEEKKDVHYVDFSPLVKLAKHFGVNPEVVATNYTKEDVVEQDLFAKGKVLVENIKSKLLNKEPSTEDIEVCNNVYDYLSEEDAPENVDIIFVFGAKTPLRINKAIELYRQGLSQIILVSGRSPYYSYDKSSTEAETYAQLAIEKGIPSSSIILENESITIPDNVRSSLNLLDKNKTSYNSIALVNSPYTQRRGWAHFKKYLPDTIRIVRINCETGDQYKRDSWYKNPAGIDTVLSEYLKAKIAVSLNTA